MDKKIRRIIFNILNDNKEILKTPLIQRAKFEGWLKFELAYALISNGMENVEVESKSDETLERADIKFIFEGKPYKIELKTPNTNWRVVGIENKLLLKILIQLL